MINELRAILLSVCCDVVKMISTTHVCVDRMDARLIGILSAEQGRCKKLRGRDCCCAQVALQWNLV
jgi:hypothetical protein